MTKLKGKILKTLRAKDKQENFDLNSKTEVLPMLRFRSKCGQNIFVNCYQIVALSNPGLFKYRVITQSKSWDVSKTEFKRIIEKISKAK